ncbi:MAG: LysR family transcriptional regulator [Bacteroidales bacterium]|nr:LysR family transcriptional regulator [Bacteroidales bacterium]
MELRQLKYFVKTAETLNFSEAARALFVTQSTLSQQVRSLEQELGVELFQRDSHSVALTESGEHLLPVAKRTLQDAELCFTQISDLRQMLSGVLNIGISYTFAPVLKEAVMEFTKQYPGVRLNVICRTMGELLDLLKRREVDFVLCFKPNILDDEIESHILFDNQLSVIVSSNHPLADRKSLAISDIMPYRIVMPARETQARNAFELYFPGVTDKLNVVVEINEVNVLLDLVRSTQMVTFLSEATLYQKGGLVAIPIEAPNTQMEGCVHTLKKVYRKRAADEFIRILSTTNAVQERANGWLK